MPTIQLYPQRSINRNIARWLEDHRMWCDDPLLGGGLKDIYVHIKDSIGDHRITHLWLLFDDGKPIGIAVIEKRHVNGLHLFVKEDYRSRGYGKQLLQQAMQSDVPFAAFYTDASKSLYSQYNIVDIEPLL